MTNQGKGKPLALDAYESIAEGYNERVLTKDYNAYLERPATLSLLPEVKGLYVLDAGCGPGHNAEWLIDHGAKVVAIDMSPQMLELTQKRLGAQVETRKVDLNHPLSFFKDAMFDLIFSALVMSYVLDWHVAFKEFYRVLKPGGRLVFSTNHPYSPSIMQVRKNYFETQRVEWLWAGFGTPVIVPFYHRPLVAMFEPILAAGFHIEKVLEPLPTEEFRKVNAEDYEKVSTRPSFLCLRIRKPAAEI
jgi:ubiquinone/menaquinone biosynthesis C-methylase UbiE